MRHQRGGVGTSRRHRIVISEVVGAAILDTEKHRRVSLACEAVVYLFVNTIVDHIVGCCVLVTKFFIALD